jgi:acyl-homoserine-lactone acylase
MNPKTTRTLAAALMAAGLAGCASHPETPTPSGGRADARSVSIVRTTHGIPHISAPDLETMAYGVAYAQAEDNVCQTARQLVTVRGQRARWFGPAALGLLGVRMLPNEIADTFVTAHMDDARLARAQADGSEAAQLSRGYVAGYNRFLSDRGANLPADCKGQPWVRPMTLADYARMNELTMVQAGVAALADGVVGAQPPPPAAMTTPLTAAPAELNHVDVAQATQAMREFGLIDSPLGSNAWAFGRETTADGRGLLLGNPHFPWVGVNRFYEMHVTVPGQLDVMGATGANGPFISIGFNQDVAWSHTVSTGKRFTLHVLTLVPGDPTRYLVDGKPENMTSRNVSIDVLNGDHTVSSRQRTLWSTRWGPVVIMPRAGLNWTATTAYAVQDANAGNTRFTGTWLAIARARGVADIRSALRGLGTPWVNTIAADRAGNALYADVSVVPDVDAAQLERCTPSKALAALRGAAGLVVLDGSQSDCDWRRDPTSPVPGLTPIERMPVAVRGDWVQNSNDSFVYTHPPLAFPGISPLVGEARVDSMRTRAGLSEIPELLARGKVTAQAVQQQLFENRNFMGQAVLPDLLAACSASPPANPAARDGCAALTGWDRRSDLDSRGAHLFREFWRTARLIPGVHRLAFDAAQPVATPSGLKMADTVIAGKVWDALAQAVNLVRTAGFALDAALRAVQRPAITDEAIALHGGEPFEGVLNYLGNQFAPGLTAKGLRVDYGTSYVQTVGFDARGPVAQAILTYGLSSDPASPHATDQLGLFSRKEWPRLPFHPEDVARAQVGATLRLVR